MGRLWVRTVVIAAVVTIVLSLGLSAGVLRGYRMRAVDALFPAADADPRVVVVGIDARSLDQTGERWPWPRDLQGRLVTALAAAGASVVVLDIVHSPATALDAQLAEAINEADVPVVVAQASTLRRAPGARLFSARSTVAPVAAIADATTVGDAATTPDADGVIRTLPAAVEGRDGTFVPSLSLAALAAFDRASSQVIVRPHGVQVGRRAVPTTGPGRLRVAFADGFATVSAADVLDGRATPRLRGAVVFVGVTDPALGDRQDTPVAPGGAPGVYVHANAFNTMLTASWMAVASEASTFAVILVVSLLTVAATSRGRLWFAALVAGFAAGAYFVSASALFDSGTEVDLVYPLLAVVVCFVAGLGVRYLVLARERRTWLEVLGQYVPTPLAKQLLTRRPHDLPTGTITFVFTDVVGSTDLWDREPRAMSDAMRRHDELVEAAVESAGGAVVRPRGEGDSRFCVFVSPTDAALAALAIHRALASEPWSTSTPVAVRIGVHTGGAELRAGDYYGTDVNRSARVRSLAGAGETVLSSVTAELARDRVPGGVLLDHGEHPLKGLDAPEHAWLLRPVTAGRVADA